MRFFVCIFCFRCACDVRTMSRISKQNFIYALLTCMEWKVGRISSSWLVFLFCICVVRWIHSIINRNTGWTHSFCGFTYFYFSFRLFAQSETQSSEPSICNSCKDFISSMAFSGFLCACVQITLEFEWFFFFFLGIHLFYFSFYFSPGIPFSPSLSISNRVSFCYSLVLIKTFFQFPGSSLDFRHTTYTFTLYAIISFVMH